MRSQHSQLTFGVGSLWISMVLILHLLDPPCFHQLHSSRLCRVPGGWIPASEGRQGDSKLLLVCKRIEVEVYSTYLLLESRSYRWAEPLFLDRMSNINDLLYVTVYNLPGPSPCHLRFFEDTGWASEARSGEEASHFGWHHGIPSFEWQVVH